MFKLIQIAPLIIVPVIVYNLIAFGYEPQTFPEGLDVAGVTIAPDQVIPFSLYMERTVISLPLVETILTISAGDLLVILGLVALFFEMLKSTKSHAATVLNHSFSMMLFVACVVEFVLIDEFATSTFALITLLALIDSLAGMLVTIQTTRRDISVGDGLF